MAGVVTGLELTLGNFGEEPRKCVLLWTGCF